jgi:hypothetical protein
MAVSLTIQKATNQKVKVLHQIRDLMLTLPVVKNSKKLQRVIQTLEIKVAEVKQEATDLVF